MIFSLCPRIQPVGTVILVLVKQISQFGCQLQHAVGLIGSEKPRNGCKVWRIYQGGQQLHEPPDHRHLVQRGARGDRFATQRLAVGSPKKTRRQLNPGGCADATDTRQLHLDPFGHAVTLNQDDFFFHGVQGVSPDPVDDHLSEVLGSVTVKSNETGLQNSWKCRGHAGRDVGLLWWESLDHRLSQGHCVSLAQAGGKTNLQGGLKSHARKVAVALSIPVPFNFFGLQDVY